MQSRAAVYTSVELSEVKAQDLGDAVVLAGIAQIKVVSNGRPNAFGVRFTDRDAHAARVDVAAMFGLAQHLRANTRSNYLTNQRS